MDTESLQTNKLFNKKYKSINFLILYFIGLAATIYESYPNYMSGLFLDTFYYDGKDYWDPLVEITDIMANQMLKVTCTINNRTSGFIRHLRNKYTTNIINIENDCNKDLVRWNADSVEYDGHIFFSVKNFEIGKFINWTKFIEDQTISIDNFSFNMSFVTQNNYNSLNTIQCKYSKDETIVSILKNNYKNIFKKFTIIDLVNDINSETKSGIELIRDYTTHSKTLNINLQKLYFTKNEDYNYPIKNDSFDDVFNIPYITKDYQPKKNVTPIYLYQEKNTRQIEFELNRYIKSMFSRVMPYIKHKYNNFYCYRYTKFLDPAKSSITTIPDIINLINNRPFIKYPYFLSTYSFLAKYISESESESHQQRSVDDPALILNTTQISLKDNEYLEDDDFPLLEDYEEKNISVISSTNWIYNPNNVIMRIMVNPRISRKFILLDPCVKKKTCYFGNEHELLFETGCVIRLINIEKVSFNIHLPEHYKYFVNCEMLTNDDIVARSIEILYNIIPHDTNYNEFKLLDKNDNEYINKLYKINDKILNKTIYKYLIKLRSNGVNAQIDDLADFIGLYKKYQKYQRNAINKSTERK